MDTLNKMQVVWPSAGRAWELLYGAKDNFNEDQQMAPPVRRPNKRATDERPDNIMQVTTPHESHPVAGLPSHFAPPTAYANPAMEAPGSNDESPLAFYTTYGRWSSDNNLLSTSVLPQQYSTGFVDERTAAAGLHRQSQILGDDGGQGRFTPQYWNDYSAVGQPSSMLNSMYGLAMLPGQMQHGGAGQAHHVDSQEQQQFQQSSMFSNDQFHNMFGAPNR